MTKYKLTANIAANSHIIHEFHLKLHKINLSDIKILRFN